MHKEIKRLYIKRSQRDYPISFKLSVVRGVGSEGKGICSVACKYGIQSETTVSHWLRKCGTFDRENTVGTTLVKPPQQKIFELKQKVRQQERQNKFLEQQIVKATDKAGILDKIIEIAGGGLSYPDTKKTVIRAIGQYFNKKHRAINTPSRLIRISRQKYYHARRRTYKKQSLSAQIVAMLFPFH